MRVRAPRDLAVAVRGRRTDLGLTQATVAARARVSRKWVYEFEAGKPRAELHRMLRVLEALGLELDVAVPEHATASDGGLHDDHAGR